MYLDRYIKDIEQICHKNAVKYLFAFGSVLNHGFNSDSDIDFLVEINQNDPIEYAEHYFNLKFELENLLNRKIDLLEQKALRNPYLAESINNTKSLIYAA